MEGPEEVRKECFGHRIVKVLTLRGSEASETIRSLTNHWIWKRRSPDF